jgi:FO synthase
MAGSYHGVKLEPEQLVGAAHAAGRPAAERSTLYRILRRYELAGEGSGDRADSAALA